jgi:hypothetical protein
MPRARDHLATTALAVSVLCCCPARAVRAQETDLVYSEQVTAESLTTALEVIRSDAVWLVFTDGTRYAGKGAVMLQGDRVLVRARSGQLLSARLATVDLAATKKLNQDLRLGHYVDRALVEWSKIQPRPLTAAERKRFAARPRAGAVEHPAAARLKPARQQRQRPP